MLPLFPFVAGLIAGATAVSLYQNRGAQDGFKGVKEKLKQRSAQVQESLRHAAVSGLSALESSSVRLRDHLQATHETPVDEPVLANEAPVDEKETVQASGTPDAHDAET